MQARLDRVRARSQQLHHYHPHGVDVADRRPGAVPLPGRLSSSQPSSATYKSVTDASGSRFSRRRVGRTLRTQLRASRTGVAQ